MQSMQIPKILRVHQMAKNPMPFPFHTLLSLCLFLSCQSVLCGNNATDVQALLAFKAAIVSDPLQALTSWNATVHFCSWSGVICSRRHSDRVVSINLTSRGLVGSLSPYIGNLSFLKNITLRNNRFSGQIPGEIGRLRRLEYIELSNNSFSGEIPRNLSQCKNLYYLTLFANNLTGTIIPEIGFLIRLQSLGLTLNKLTGTIPPWIGNLTFLVRLSLANCGLEGQIPEEIGRLRRLELVDISNNSFSGKIPRNLSECINLRTLILINNKLTGRIMPEIGSLIKLQILNFSLNRFFGSINPWIGNLTSLGVLALASCSLDGQIPESLTRLPNLRFLMLFENRLTGSIPSKLFNSSIIQLSLGSNKLQGMIPFHAGHTLSNIKVLQLENNNLSGEIPSSLVNASSLEVISLALNNFRGPMPRNLGRLTNLWFFNVANNSIRDDFNFISSLTNCTGLRDLVVDGNPLNGMLPDSIANLSITLRVLVMFNNNIHGRIPYGIGNLVNLLHLILGNNYLFGPIPSSIGNLVKLEEFVLHGNRFTGDIPPSLGNLTQLSGLYLGYNNLSGHIPASFGNARNLLTFDLSHNNLNGALPQAVFNLSFISILFNLAYNELTGAIPPEVGRLRNLAYLDLSNNRLLGPIPNAMSSCESLERLHLEGNSFEGEVPAGFSNLRALQDLDLSRNHLSGPIPSFLGELHLLINLNLSFNSFRGQVPTSRVFRNKSAISIDGNIDLCGGVADLMLPSCPTMNSKSRKLSKALKIAVPIGVLGVIFSIVIVFLCVLMLKRKRCGNDTTSMPSLDGHFMRLSYVDLLKATSEFSTANLIGAGRFGSVYKGILDDRNTIIAVKVLNLDVRGASKTFMAECNALKGIRHRNLIKILSACHSIDFQGRDFKALVYEYKSNGSLEEWLHHHPNKQGDERRHLTMIQKLNVAIDIAFALEYLHYGTNSTVIHGDLKPSNILLDDDMTAYVGDFGLAKVVLGISKNFVANESNSSVIKGTIGYIAPEYGMGDMVSTQGDTYSFGIVLLEMFTEIRPTDKALEDHSNLHSFVAGALPDSMVDILDPFIVQELQVSDDHKAKEYLLSVLKIGVSCSDEFPRNRMAMTDVVTELKKLRSGYLAERMS